MVSSAPLALPAPFAMAGSTTEEHRGLRRKGPRGSRGRRGRNKDTTKQGNKDTVTVDVSLDHQPSSNKEAPHEELPAKKKRRRRSRSKRGDRKPQHPQADFEELDQSSSSEPEAAAVHGDHDSEREQHAAPAQARGDPEQQRDMEETPRQRRSFTREKIAYWIANSKLTFHSSISGLKFSLENLLRRGKKTILGKFGEIVRLRQVVALLLEMGQAEELFARLCAPGVLTHHAAAILARYLADHDGDVELTAPIQVLLVHEAWAGKNHVIGVFTITHLSSEEFVLDNIPLRGFLTWPAIFKENRLEAYQRKKQLAELNGGPGPRRLAPRVALRGHLYHIDDACLIASAEHANGGPHSTGIPNLQRGSDVALDELFTKALEAAKA